MAKPGTGETNPHNHPAWHRWAYRAARLCWLLVFALSLLLFLALWQSNYRMTFFSEHVELSVELLRYLVSRRQLTSYLSTLRVGVTGIYILAAAIIFFKRVWPRRSRDWVAWLVSLTLLLVVTAFGGEVRQYSQPPFRFALLSTLQSLLFFFQAAGLFNTLYLFPNGKIVPARMRGLILANNAFLIFIFLTSGVSERLAPQISEILFGSLLILMALFLVIGIAGQVYRYFRVSTAQQRQQTKWVLAAFLLQGLGPLSLLLPEDSSNLLLERLSAVLILHLEILLPALIPLAFLVAMLRYHLFDIDLIVRRTLVYGTLVGLLTFMFLVLVTALQSLFVPVSRQQSALSIVLSTLVIAALFNPLRLRLKATIDRRFYRRVYDAEQAVAEFSSRVRAETEIGSLTTMLAETVTQTMQPEHLSLWLGGEPKGLAPEDPHQTRRPS
jgi:hypothetical protein